MFFLEEHFPEQQILLLESIGNTSQSDKKKHVGVATLGETTKRKLVRAAGV